MYMIPSQEHTTCTRRSVNTNNLYRDILRGIRSLQFRVYVCVCTPKMLDGLLSLTNLYFHAITTYLQIFYFHAITTPLDL